MDAIHACELMEFHRTYVTCGCTITGNVVLYVTDEIVQIQAK